MIYCTRMVAGISVLNEKSSGLRNPQELDLSVGWLRELPREISQLKNLRALDVSSNCWLSQSSIENICEIAQLQNLSLCYSGLEELPPAIQKLRNLKSLNLGFSRLSQSSIKNLATLAMLQSLNLQSNGLRELPARNSTINKAGNSHFD